MFILAPLRGVTGLRFRIAFMQHFAGLDRAVAPFIATVAGERVKPAVLNGIRPDWQPSGLALTPQVIGRDAAQLSVMLHDIMALGYDCCDLNAGCPWPFVTKKGRGCGLLEDEKALRSMLDVGCTIMPNGFSIKVRLGLKNPDVLARKMAILNDYPLREVCIHPRTATQMYEGSVDLDRFFQAAHLCKHPVVYNGDLVTPADYARYAKRFPLVKDWMIGRGLCTNPFLLEMIQTGTDTRDEGRFRAWLSTLTDLYARENNGSAPFLGRMKELWKYLALGLDQGDRLWNAIKVTRTADEYHRVIDCARIRFKQ